MFEELKIIIEEMRKGVPLGYFTSQWFGNFYLKALDHYIKEDSMQNITCDTWMTW